jgi:pimeloyl-ACP methyl ester carboxylesterase
MHQPARNEPAPRSRHVALGTGLRYHVLCWGPDEAAPADAPPVILLHGFLDMAWGWEETARDLAGPLRLYAPDLRGHGDSDPIGPGGYYHFLDYLADLHELIDALCPAGGQVALVGHSMGGTVAAYYAGSFPARVSRLAVLEGLGPPESAQEMPQRVATWLHAWRRVRERPERVYPDVAAAAARLREHDPLLGEALALRLAARGTRPVPGGGVRFKHDPLHVTPGPYPFRLELAEGFWRRISCPTLLVSGSETSFRYAPEDEARRLSCFRHASRAVIEGAGHMMQRHRPRELAQVLRAFLLPAP